MTTTVDVTPAAVAVRGTYIDAVAIDELFVDHSYQRPLDTARARQLARTWDRRLAGVVEASDRGASQVPRYAIIDGQHRWAAAQLLEPAPMMVATIHEGLAVADEAALFDRLNRERRRPATWDHWRARSSAADPTVLAIEHVVAEIGLRIDTAPREGNVRCTSTLEKLHALGGVDLVRDTLALIVDVWDIRKDAFDALIVHGLGLILHYLHGRIDQERLVDSLMGVYPRQLKTHAANLRETTTGTQPKLIAIAIMTAYNRNRRVPGNRILVSSRTFGGGARNAHSLPLAAKSA